MTTTDTPTAEITIVVPEREQLPPSLLSNIETGFKESFAQAEKWRTQALAIQITSADQKPEMQQARIIRLALKNTRVAADKTRKNLKADALLMGRAIDGVYNLLEAAIVPLERHLEEQEKFAERLAEAERQRVKAEREAALSPFLDMTMTMALPDLSSMTAEQWEGYLADAKLLHEAKIEQARKAEAERIAAEQAAAAERERQRIELERLRKEAVEREAAAKAEREAAEKERRIAEAFARSQREALEIKHAEEVAAAAEVARKEREAAQAKADAERAEERKKAVAAYEKIKKAEREYAAKYAAEEAKAAAEKAAREKLEAELAAKQAAEAKAVADAAAAQKKAARAPDKQKALTFAATVRTLKAPTATTEEGKAVMAEITAKVESFASWIEKQASNL